MEEHPFLNVYLFRLVLKNAILCIGCEVFSMSFDGVVTRAVVHELSEQLVTGRILKIYQPTNSEIVLTVRAKGKNKQLLLSVHPNYARIHISNTSLKNPKEPPMFCMVLRKYLTGGFIEKIEQVELERIVVLHIRSHNEIGDTTTKKLVIEIMGKHSNVMLVDGERNVILDSIKHISPSQNRYRTILPGQPYIFPPNQGKINPLTISSEEFIKKLDFNQGKLDKQMLSLAMGFSPVITKEITERSFLGSAEKYKEIFSNIQNVLLNHQYTPIIYLGEKEQFYVLELSTIKGEKEVFPSVNAMLDRFYSGKAERDRVKQQSRDFYRHLLNEKNKLIRKVKKQKKTILKAEKADYYQKLGELLTAHMHLVKKGDDSVKVVDYYDPEQKEIVIELNPNKSPSENAQSFFQTYHKLKKSKEHLQKEIEKATLEIAYLDQLLQQLESAREEDLEEIREELQEQGYLKKRISKKVEKKKHNKPSLDEYVASDGTLIYVGRNNKQNDYLTNRFASKNHIWLHAKDIPGSHVVIQSENPEESTLKEAAIIAAFYSKAKHSSSVPVDYTEVKNVKKPSGAKPGFVIYEKQKTLYVTPDEYLISKLKKA